MLTDVTIDTLHVALRGLAERQRATADNVSNLETPMFLARKVEFESSLRRALLTGQSPAVAAPETSRSTDPVRDNGNNVELDAEIVRSVDTGLRYRLATEALNSKFHLLRTAIRGGAL